jgi:hypothetical protein
MMDAEIFKLFLGALTGLTAFMTLLKMVDMWISRKISANMRDMRNDIKAMVDRFNRFDQDLNNIRGVLHKEIVGHRHRCSSCGDGGRVYFMGDDV